MASQSNPVDVENSTDCGGEQQEISDGELDSGNELDDPSTCTPFVPEYFVHSNSPEKLFDLSPTSSSPTRKRWSLAGCSGLWGMSHNWQTPSLSRSPNGASGPLRPPRSSSVDGTGIAGMNLTRPQLANKRPASVDLGYTNVFNEIPTELSQETSRHENNQGIKKADAGICTTELPLSSETSPAPITYPRNSTADHVHVGSGQGDENVKLIQDDVETMTVGEGGRYEDNIGTRSCYEGVQKEKCTGVSVAPGTVHIEPSHHVQGETRGVSSPREGLESNNNPLQCEYLKDFTEQQFELSGSLNDNSTRSHLGLEEHGPQSGISTANTGIAHDVCTDTVSSSVPSKVREANKNGTNRDNKSVSSSLAKREDGPVLDICVEKQNSKKHTEVYDKRHNLDASTQNDSVPEVVHKPESARRSKPKHLWHRVSSSKSQYKVKKETDINQTSNTNDVNKKDKTYNGCSCCSAPLRRMYLQLFT